MWFAPLLECQSPSLNNFETFVKQFNASFGDSNRECTTIKKLQSFHQGPHLTIVYSYEFRHLTCDNSWNEVALMSQFQFGLQGLIAHNVRSYNIESNIAQVVQCDNKLFEWCQEKHWKLSPFQKYFMAITPSPPMAFTPKDDPMWINKTWFKPFMEQIK